MDIEEFSLWAVYLQDCDPPREVRADRRAAMVARSVVAGEFNPKDFAPARSVAARDAADQIERDLKQWCANTGKVMGPAKR